MTQYSVLGAGAEPPFCATAFFATGVPGVLGEADGNVRNDMSKIDGVGTDTDGVFVFDIALIVGVILSMWLAMMFNEDKAESSVIAPD